MTQILVVGEDELCCALGERLVGACLPGWVFASESINTRGVTKLKAALPRYLNYAEHVRPVLCVADTDGRCPVEWLEEALPDRGDAPLLLRLAVTEAESWVLADGEAFANVFGVARNRLPRDPDSIQDAKRHVLNLVHHSRSRVIRNEMVSSLDSSKTGSGYNVHLCGFVRAHWRAHQAAERSSSLGSAVRRLKALGA